MAASFFAGPGAARLEAIDVFWVGPEGYVSNPYPDGGGGYYGWTSSFDWTTRAPTSVDRAIFNGTGRYGVSVSGGTSNQLLVSDGQVNFLLSTNFTNLSTSTSSATPAFDVSKANATGAGAVLWFYDSLTTQVYTNNGAAFIGNQAGSAGSVYVGNPQFSGPSFWTNLGDVYVGNAGTGTLLVNIDSTVRGVNGQIGFLVGSNGLATVAGSGALWALSGALNVGHSGTGTLLVDTAANVTSVGATIGYAAGSVGTATVTGRTINTFSRWTNTGLVEIGRAGSGSLTLSAGGSLVTGSAYLADLPGSNGTVIVTDTGSRLQVGGNLYVGGSATAAGGTGLLTIANNGLVTASLTKIWPTQGTVTISSGARLLTSSLDATTITNNGILQIGGSSTSSSLNSAVVGTGNLTKAGTGTLTVIGNKAHSGGTTVSSGRLLLADGSALAGTGAVTVASGARLAGDGTIAGTVTAAAESTLNAGNGGAVSPGSNGGTGEGIGKLAISDNVVLNTGSSFDFEFQSVLLAGNGPLAQAQYAGTEWDLLTTTGTLSFASGVVHLNVFSMINDSQRGLNAAHFAPLATFPTASQNDPVQWLFAHADGGIVSATTDINDQFVIDASQVSGLYGSPGLAGSFWVSKSGSDLYLNYSAVPEPGSMMLTGFAALGFCVRAYRRRADGVRLRRSLEL